MINSGNQGAKLPPHAHTQWATRACFASALHRLTPLRPMYKPSLLPSPLPCFNVAHCCKTGTKTKCTDKSGDDKTGNRRICCCLLAGDNPADASDLCPMLKSDCSSARAWTPSGRVCVKRSSGCPLGEWLNETHAPVQCIQCPPAQYGIAAAQVTRDAACAACAPGKMSIAGSTSCSTCVAGKWADPQNKKECVKCAKGWYRHHAFIRASAVRFTHTLTQLPTHTHTHVSTHTHGSRKVWCECSANIRSRGVRVLPRWDVHQKFWHGRV